MFGLSLRQQCENKLLVQSFSSCSKLGILKIFVNLKTINKYFLSAIQMTIAALA